MVDVPIILGGTRRYQKLFSYLVGRALKAPRSCGPFFHRAGLVGGDVHWSRQKFGSSQNVCFGFVARTWRFLLQLFLGRFDFWAFWSFCFYLQIFAACCMVFAEVLRLFCGRFACAFGLRAFAFFFGRLAAKGQKCQKKLQTNLQECSSMRAVHL